MKWRFTQTFNIQLLMLHFQHAGCAHMENVGFSPYEFQKNMAKASENREP